MIQLGCSLHSTVVNPRWLTGNAFFLEFILKFCCYCYEDSYGVSDFKHSASVIDGNSDCVIPAEMYNIM